ncbi:hypothetical protein H8356DRAFT_1654009 [Neocallimastix lanati (nom. inval.)]|nr:hypothetical protein H8356DRAFT_1654009 [Neocallimastix sp. JGI-2020a]
MPHFFNTPHAFKKIGETQPGEMQFGEMPHTLKLNVLNFTIWCIFVCGLIYYLYIYL